jgi:DNA-binding NarL/FixJ family response regulator
MRKLQVFLADDHAMLRAGLKRLIESETDMEVIGEAGTGTAAVEQILGLQPNVAVLDISMPEINGLEVVRRVRGICPEIKILILTVHEDRTYSRELLESGALGYLLKRAAADELILAIRNVAAGGMYVDPRISDKLIGSLVESPAETISAGAQLSEREQRVLQLIAQGYSNKEIGAQLALSVKTIETYKARSMEKLQLHSRVDIVRYAQKAGWLNGL